MNNKILIISIFILLAGFFITPILVDVLTVYTYDNFSNSKTGESNVIKIYIDTNNQEINVLEGKFKINGPVEISNINTNGSVFSLWAEKPEFLSDTKEINFIGGTPGGVYGKDLRLLNFNITRVGKGKISIDPVGVVAYLNDGTGTSVKNTNLKMEVDMNALGLTKILRSILIAVILFTIINILRQFLIKKNK